MDDGSLRDNWFTNLEAARRISQSHNTPLWNVILANSHFRYADPSSGGFRFQVYTALAYGSRGIGYFTFTGRDRGNYHNAAIDLFGHRTPTFDMIRDINLQLHRLAPTITKLKNVNVFHHPEVPRGSKSLADSRFLKDVKGAGPFCIGEFEDPDGKPALIIVNRDRRHSTQLTIVAKTSSPVQRISAYTGKERPWGG